MDYFKITLDPLSGPSWLFKLGWSFSTKIIRTKNFYNFKIVI